MAPRSPTILVLIPCALVALAFYSFAFVGYNGTDDRSYLLAAENWLASGVYIGDTHWALRHALVLPLALSLKLFGPSEFAFLLPSMLYFFALLGLFTWAVWTLFGPWQGAAFLVLFASTPLFAVFGSTTFVDLFELTYLAICLLLFFSGTQTGRWPYFALAGLALGLGFEARETTVALVAFFGLLFLIGWRTPRRSYVVFFLFAGLVVLLEMAFYAAHGLSPLYRLETMTRTHGGLESITSVTEYSSGTGNLSNDRILGPISSILVNQEFAFLFWIAPFFAYYLFRKVALTPRQRDFLILFCSAGLFWFLFVGFSGMVRPWPRYYHLFALTAVLLNAVGIGFLLQRGRRLAACAALAVLLGGSALGLLVENTDNRYAERALARFLAETDATVYTDPRTHSVGEPLFRWADEDFPARVIAAPPPPGALFFHNPNAIAYGRAAGVGNFDRAKFKPDPDWPVVWRYAKPPRPAYAIVDALGLVPLLPQSVLKKLTDPEVRVLRAEPRSD